MNLLTETLEILAEHGKGMSDIIVICGDDFQITKDNFMKCADVEYDSGYGAAEVAPDLKLIGEDFWLERAEYDGSEWWEYKTIPEFEHLPEKTVKRVLGGMWESLSELQDDE